MSAAPAHLPQTADRGGPAQPMLIVDGLQKHFPLSNGGAVRAVDGVSFTVAKGETLGIVGESGCGKSTLARLLLHLIQPDKGELVFDGEEVGTPRGITLKSLRRQAQMVFQDSNASLNPRRRIGDLIAEPLRVHPGQDGRARSKNEIKDRLLELVDLVGLAPEHLDRFPHEFSGGQRQRIGIARALALNPALVVADESVSALDVSVQAQVVNLFMDLQEKLGVTYVFIAHDLSVVRQVSERTAVMYLGALVETGATEALFRKPAHPYTAALISAVPVADVCAPKRERIILRGDIPSPIDPPSGCRFHTRCPHVQARCRIEPPVLRTLSSERAVACHFPLG